jgi:hypothetical protein
MPHGRYFFATAGDLLPGLQRFEQERPVRYAQSGYLESRIPVLFDSATDLPGLGIARSGDAVHEPAFLVLPRDAETKVRQVPQGSGEPKFAIDQLENPDSTVFRSGGLYQELVVISGEIATTGTTAVAVDLHRLMVRTVTKGFRRVQSFWVGPEALSRLSRGGRLTRSVNSPAINDLRAQDDVEKTG